MSDKTPREDFQTIEDLAESVIETARNMSKVCDMIIAMDFKRDRNKPEKMISYIQDFEGIAFMEEMGKLANLVVATKEAHLAISNVATFLKMSPGVSHPLLKRRVEIIKKTINKKIEEYNIDLLRSTTGPTIVPFKN